MNKKIFLYILMLFCFFSVVIDVYAADCNNFGCAKCVYKTNDWEFVYDLSSNGDGTADLNFSGTILTPTRNLTYIFSQSLVSQNFISQEKNVLVCPLKLYYKKSNGGVVNNIVRNVISVFDTEQKEHIYGKDYVVTKIINLDSSSTNNNKTLSVENVNQNISCSKEVTYGNSNSKVKVTVTRVNDTLKYEFNNSNFKVSKSSLTPEDFNNGCPNYYVSCGAYNSSGTCAFSMTNDFSMRDYEASESTKESAIDECGQGYMKDESGNCGKCRSGYFKYGTECLSVCPEGTIAKDGKICENKVVEQVASDPCGEDSIKKLLRFFGYLLLIAKVVIPLIIIGFGTFDLFKAVTDKDEKSLGKQIKVLGIRIFTGIFVFFIPNLVYAVFGLTEKLNVIEQDKYKTCANCLLKPTSAECQIEEDTDDNSDNNTHQSSSGRTHGGTGGSF